MANSIFVKLHVALSLLEEGLSTIVRFFKHSNSQMSMWLSRWAEDQETPLVHDESNPLDMTELTNWVASGDIQVSANDYQLIVQNESIYASSMIVNSQSASLEDKWTALNLVQRLIGSEQDSVESVGETGQGFSSFWFDNAKLITFLQTALDNMLDGEERFFSLVFGSTHSANATTDTLYGAKSTIRAAEVAQNGLVIAWQKSGEHPTSASFESLQNAAKTYFRYDIYDGGAVQFQGESGSHTFSYGLFPKVSIVGLGRKVSGEIKLRGLYATCGIYTKDNSQASYLDDNITFRLTKLDNNNLEYYNSINV